MAGAPPLYEAIQTVLRYVDREGCRMRPVGAEQERKASSITGIRQRFDDYGGRQYLDRY